LKTRTYLSIPYIIWIFVFTVAPLFLIAWYAIYNKGFTLNNIMLCFQPIYLRIILYSLWVAFLTTIICLGLGYPIAVILSGDTFKHKGVLLFLLLAPMWMNYLIRTYSWLTILENNGIINNIITFLGLPRQQLLYTNTSVYLGMVYNFLPFMVLPIHSVISKIDVKLIEAARDLGSSKKEVFKKIIFPLSLPGVFSGILMVFMPAVTTFVIPRLLGGGKKEMIGNVIEQQFIVSGNWGLGAALSLLLMLIILLCVHFLNKRSAEGGALL